MIKSRNILLFINIVLLFISCNDGENDPFILQKGLIGLYGIVSLVIGLPLIIGISWHMLKDQDSTNSDRLKGFFGLLFFVLLFFLIFKAFTK